MTERWKQLMIHIDEQVRMHQYWNAISATNSLQMELHTLFDGVLKNEPLPYHDIPSKFVSETADDDGGQCVNCGSVGIDHYCRC